MKKASIISIGDELLAGRSIDTNGAYLSEQMVSAGIPVITRYTVGDHMNSITRILKLAADEADIVVLTGGLGPTDDDLTRQALADFLQVELELDETLLDKLKDFFRERNKYMPKANEIQAYLPAGAQPIPNPRGTAPGVMAQRQKTYIFALPGVPSEMSQMFNETVMPGLDSLIEQKQRQICVTRKLRCFGQGESTIAQMLEGMMKRGQNPLVNSTAAQGVITLHIVATAEDKTTATKMIDEKEALIREKLGDIVFGIDNETLAEVVGQKLKQAEKKLATAESCTAGLLAKLITDVPGSSQYYCGGWITYSNKMKIQQLDIDDALIDSKGAVSEEVVREMAKSCREKSGSDYSVAITGIAGPGGDTEQKPAGLVYIAVDSQEDCQIQKFMFSAGRNSVRLKAALTGLNMLRMAL